MQDEWQAKVAVLYTGEGDIDAYRNLAQRLGIPFFTGNNALFKSKPAYFLTWQQGCLAIIDSKIGSGRGLSVEVEHRQGEQRSWPIAKQGPLAQALGRKTKTVIDATAGWGQDCLAIFRMGYEVVCLERSPVMAELLADGIRRLNNLHWVRELNIGLPRLQLGDAIESFDQFSVQPDCIYLDPMFPPKRKKSALAKKSMLILRDLVGDDYDKDNLFNAALAAAGKRVVVKRPDYASPLGPKPDESFAGKLLRYDVYFK